MKSKKQINPVEALAKMQRDKMGMAVGSMLEGGGIIYKDGGPGGPDKKEPTQEVKLDEVDADTSNIVQKGLFRRARARKHAKNNPGTASSVRNYGKRRVVTTYNDDGFKGKSIRKNV
tara:strand:- start:16 stop:366 length:351 start_codon:yes stop_codon:yes gene_type:complete